MWVQQAFYESTSVPPAVFDLRLGMRLQPVKALFANQTNNFTITYSSSSSRALLGLIFAHQNQGQQTLVLSSIPAEAFLLAGVNDQVHVRNGDGGLSMGSEQEIDSNRQVTWAQFDQCLNVRALWICFARSCWIQNPNLFAWLLKDLLWQT